LLGAKIATYTRDSETRQLGATIGKNNLDARFPRVE